MKAICATDLSAASEATIENETCLECLGRIGVEEIHLVTVISSNVHAGMPGMDFEKRREQALGRYRRVIEDAGFDVESHVVRGTPHRRINGIAGAVGASLTVVGSRGKSPLENRVIGSTARNLARTTVVPLLVNRIEREADEPDVVREHLFQRMLYATDFSENAERAFEAFSYLRHATREGHAGSRRNAEGSGTSGGRRPQRATGGAGDPTRGGGIETRTAVRQGDPADEILAAEDEYEPTSILIGSRGHSRLRRLLLGSVSEDIVARADGTFCSSHRTGWPDTGGELDLTNRAVNVHRPRPRASARSPQISGRSYSRRGARRRYRWTWSLRAPTRRPSASLHEVRRSTLPRERYGRPRAVDPSADSPGGSRRRRGRNRCDLSRAARTGVRLTGFSSLLGRRRSRRSRPDLALVVVRQDQVRPRVGAVELIPGVEG